MTYAEQGREGIAALGVELLQRSIIQLAPALDEAAWQGVMRSLSLACSHELATPLFRHRSFCRPSRSRPSHLFPMCAQTQQPAQ